jgi:hypothetical protein
MSPALFLLAIIGIESQTFAHTSLRQKSSYLYLLHSWIYVCHLAWLHFHFLSVQDGGLSHLHATLHRYV